MFRKESENADEKSGTTAQEGRQAADQASPQMLTDDQMVTERKLPRRSFLTAAGTLLAGGAAILAVGRRAAAQDADPDAKKNTDPDQKKKDTDPDSKKDTDPDSKKGKKKRKKGKDTDPDQGKE